MSRIYLGAAGKRKATPFGRRKREVEYRHSHGGMNMNEMHHNELHPEMTDMSTPEEKPEEIIGEVPDLEVLEPASPEFDVTETESDESSEPEFSAEEAQIPVFTASDDEVTEEPPVSEPEIPAETEPELPQADDSEEPEVSKTISLRLKDLLYTEHPDRYKEEIVEHADTDGMTRKEKRQQARDESVQDLIDTPHSGVLEMLTRPATSMEKVSMVDDLTISPMMIFIMNFVKWFGFGEFLAGLAKQLVNTETLGFERIGFNQEVMMALKVTVFCLLAEYAADFVISIVSGLLKRPVKMMKITEINGRSSLFMAVLFIASAVLLRFNTAAAAGLFIGSCVIGLILKGFSLDLFLSLSKNMQAAILLVCTAAIGFAGYKFFGFAFSEIIDILKTALSL